MDPNQAREGGFTPLYIAAYNGLSRVVRLLLSQPGVDINATDDYGDSPMSGAKKQGHTEIVKKLEEAGAKE